VIAYVPTAPSLEWMYLYIKRGLVEYLWCSFKDSALFGTPGFLYDLGNGPDFTKIEPYDAEMNAYVWGSAFWEIRHKLDKATVDKLLVTTWKRLKESPPRDANAPSFVAELIQTDQALHSGTHVNVITEVFARRQLDWSRLLKIKPH
jgi:hypothetical protein